MHNVALCCTKSPLLFPRQTTAPLALLQTHYSSGLQAGIQNSASQNSRFPILYLSHTQLYKFHMSWNTPLFSPQTVQLSLTKWVKGTYERAQTKALKNLQISITITDNICTVCNIIEYMYIYIPAIPASSHNAKVTPIAPPIAPPNSRCQSNQAEKILVALETCRMHRVIILLLSWSSALPDLLWLIHWTGAQILGFQCQTKSSSCLVRGQMWFLSYLY